MKHISKNNSEGVSLFHSLEVETVKQTEQMRNAAGNSNETTSLKALANKVLARNTSRNKAETKVQNLVSPEKCDETEFINELFEERAAIIEFDGGFSREEAEYLARIEIKLLAGKDERNKN